MTSVTDGTMESQSLAIPDATGLQGIDNNTLLVMSEYIEEQGLQWLEQVSDVATVRHEHGKAKAFAEYLKQTLQERDVKLEAGNHIRFFTLMAEYDMGGYLPEVISHGGDRKSSSSNSNLISLDDLNISPYQSSDWQKRHKQYTRAQYKALCITLMEQGEELSAAAVDKAAKMPHVAYNAGENEWYTPRSFVDAARRVMGDIDLDPASSFEANKVVGARMFYDLQTDGLAHDWHGRVWMNPPYSVDKIGLFMRRLHNFYESGDVTEACVLVNNATETSWFQLVARLGVCVCFPSPRVPFWEPGGRVSQPLQGQAILYLGEHKDDFLREFTEFGLTGVLK